MATVSAATPASDRCSLCGGGEFAVAYPGTSVEPAGAETVYRITHSSRNRIGGILRCCDCGLRILPECTTGSARYADALDLAYIADREQRIDNASLLLGTLPPETGGRLLDVGCACGFLLEAAARRGFQPVGVELSEWAVAYARREFGAEVHRGTLADQDFANASFDVVVMADVIEHLPDPVSELRRVYDLLRPGGLILILTPDIGSLAARLAGRHWWALLDDHHCYFSAATIALLLRNCNFELRWCRALGRRFRLGHWVEKLSQYNRALYRVADSMCGGLQLRNVPVYFNMFDQMACLAAKPAGGQVTTGRCV